MLTHLILVFCVFSKLGLKFYGHRVFVTSANRGNYVQMLRLLASYSASLKAHTDNNCVYLGLSPEIKNELITLV